MIKYFSSLTLFQTYYLVVAVFQFVIHLLLLLLSKINLHIPEMMVQQGMFWLFTGCRVISVTIFFVSEPFVNRFRWIYSNKIFCSIDNELKQIFRINSDFSEVPRKKIKCKINAIIDNITLFISGFNFIKKNFLSVEEKRVKSFAKYPPFELSVLYKS